MYNVEFTIREIGENTRSQVEGLRQELHNGLNAMRQEMYRALDGMDKRLGGMSQEIKDVKRDLMTFMGISLTLVTIILSVVVVLAR